MTRITYETLIIAFRKYYDFDNREQDAENRFMELVKIFPRIGVNYIEDIEKCFELYDHYEVPRKLNRKRDGSITRFTDIILLAVGRSILAKHPYCVDPIHDINTWKKHFENWFNKLEANDIQSGKLNIK